MEVGGQAGTAGGPAVRLVGESRRWHRRVGTWRGLPAGGAGRTGPVQGEGRQARMQMNTGS